jgi:hypothetical protein
MFPNLLIRVVSEHHVVVHIEKSWVVKDLTIVNNTLNSFVESFIKLWVANVSDAVGIQNLTQVSRLIIINIFYDQRL